jgi:hypothetical protein
MGKGARIRRERREGLRKPGRLDKWDKVPAGFKFIIPNFAMLRAGEKPILVPIAESVKYNKPRPAHLVGLPLGEKKYSQGLRETKEDDNYGKRTE